VVFQEEYGESFMSNQTNVLPAVIDSNGRYERVMDPYSALFRERIIFLGTPINAQVANNIIAQLFWLNSENPNQPINLYINSPGGDVYAGLAIYDTMQLISAPVSTWAVGVTASMGTVLLTAGAKGRRYALPHATIHMHPASSGAQGYTEDVRIAFRELERVQTQLFYLVGKHTGHHWREIEEQFERDRWMNALEAQKFGLVDEVVGDVSDVIVIDKTGEIALATGAALEDKASTAAAASA
jgi:ATP-dependent Clp protease protease subunit